MYYLLLVSFVVHCIYASQEPTLREIACQTDEYIYTPQLKSIVSFDQSPDSPDSLPTSPQNSSDAEASVEIEVGNRCCFKVRCKCKCKKILKDVSKAGGGAVAGIIIALLAL